MPKVAKPKAPKQLRGGLDASPALPVDRASLTHEQQVKERLDALATTACSGQWYDDIRSGETDYPVPGMVLSRCRVLTTGEMVSNNHGEVGTRRWHPELTDRLEDMLDRMPIGKAGHYFHPPAIRYDHTRPREGLNFDPRENDPRRYSANDAPAWILRCVRLEPWPVKRENVRIRRGRRVIGFVESCWAFGVLDLAADLEVNAYLQVTE